MRTLKPANTQTFEHTITGLLAKRANLFGEAIGLRDRLGEIKNDVAAIDRVLGTLGYTGDLEAHMPRRKQEGAVVSSGERPHARWTLSPEGAGPLWARLNKTTTLQ